jgi:hypothetical protein
MSRGEYDQYQHLVPRTWDWEWSQASRFWLEGMSPAGLAKFKTVSFEKLKAMKTPKGIPILDGALLSIANAPDSHDNR